MRKRGQAISIALEPKSVPASMGASPAREQHAMTPAERELQLIERAKQDPRRECATGVGGGYPNSPSAT